MSEMVERVAKVIDGVSERLGPSQDWGDEDLLEIARAAIAVMREPSEEVLTAADGVTVTYPGLEDNLEHTLSSDEATALWKTMIDAALKD